MTARIFPSSGVVARCTYLVNSSRYLPHRFWLGAAALWLMAALLRWCMAPAFETRALELWMPLTFAAPGLIWIGAGFYTLRRGPK